LQLVVVQKRLLNVIFQGISPHGGSIAMHQPGSHQFGKQQSGAAGGVEVIDIRQAIGIDPCQQRHNF